MTWIYRPMRIWDDCDTVIIMCGYCGECDNDRYDRYNECDDGDYQDFHQSSFSNHLGVHPRNTSGHDDAVDAN